MQSKKLFQLITLILFGFGLYYIYTTYKNVQLVLSYRPLVQKMLSETPNQLDEDLVLAMIYTESKGKEIDLMQSSESHTESIENQEDSIRQGLAVLSKNIDQATKQGLDEWTAVQAYNYGQNYISYVAQHGGQNTIKVSKAYSKQILAPSLGNHTAETYHYYHPVSLYYGGGKLYKNGGNIYYSRQVKFNLCLLTLFG